jgi:hypothetical protein
MESQVAAARPAEPEPAIRTSTSWMGGEGGIVMVLCAKRWCGRRSGCVELDVECAVRGSVEAPSQTLVVLLFSSVR